MRERMIRAAGLGFLAAAVDCRYHGERAAPGAVTPYEGYQDALVRYTQCHRKRLSWPASELGSSACARARLCSQPW